MYDLFFFFFFLLFEYAVVPANHLFLSAVYVKS